MSGSRAYSLKAWDLSSNCICDEVGLRKQLAAALFRLGHGFSHAVGVWFSPLSFLP
jgi:hypothetical protein